jgi:hypothetical protein
MKANMKNIMRDAMRDAWFTRIILSLAIIIGCSIFGMGIGMAFNLQDAGSTAGFGAGIFIWGLIIAIQKWRY